jgi:hypothetical protein
VRCYYPHEEKKRFFLIDDMMKKINTEIKANIIHNTQWDQYIFGRKFYIPSEELCLPIYELLFKVENCIDIITIIDQMSLLPLTNYEKNIFIYGLSNDKQRIVGVVECIHLLLIHCLCDWSNTDLLNKFQHILQNCLNKIFNSQFKNFNDLSNIITMVINILSIGLDNNSLSIRKIDDITKNFLQIVFLSCQAGAISEKSLHKIDKIFYKNHYTSIAITDNEIKILKDKIFNAKNHYTSIAITDNEIKILKDKIFNANDKQKSNIEQLLINERQQLDQELDNIQNQQQSLLNQQQSLLEQIGDLRTQYLSQKSQEKDPQLEYNPEQAEDKEQQQENFFKNQKEEVDRCQVSNNEIQQQIQNVKDRLNILQTYYYNTNYEENDLCKGLKEIEENQEILNERHMEILRLSTNLAQNKISNITEDDRLLLQVRMTIYENQQQKLQNDIVQIHQNVAAIYGQHVLLQAQHIQQKLALNTALQAIYSLPQTQTSLASSKRISFKQHKMNNKKIYYQFLVFLVLCFAFVYSLLSLYCYLFR